MIVERLAQLGGAVLNEVGKIPGGASVVRSIDQAARRARHRELEEKLAAANAEIEMLRARLAAATRQPNSFAQMHAEKMAIVRHLRLWMARGGDRQI